MKSLLFRICICAMLLALVLSACAPTPAAVEPQVVTQVIEKEKTVEVKIVVTATPQAVEVKPFRAAYVQLSTNKDSSWGQSMYDSLVAVQKELGEDKFQFDVSENMANTSDAIVAIRDYAASGKYDLVIAHSAGYGAGTAELAPDFPDVSFAIAGTKNTYRDEGVENIFAYGSDAQYIGYLSGVMAAMMTKSGIIGFCGPVNTGDNHLFGAGFLEGVKATKPSVKVNDIWTGNFNDVTLMASCAETQIQGGADVMAGGSQASVGSVGIAQEKGIPYFYFQGDYSEQAPKAIVTSGTYYWVDILKDIVKLHQAGILGDKVYRNTLKNGGIKVVFNPHYQVPADVKAAYDAAYDKIIKGEINLDNIK